jgi:hypothetical protein
VALVLPKDDLAFAQQSLARAIGRAKAGEDRELAQKVRDGGESLAHLLGGLLKMSRVHAADNRAFEAPVEGFVKALGQLSDLLGPVHLAAVEDQVYVNDVRIRTEGKGGAKDVGAELAKHNAGGMSFHAPLGTAEVRALVAAFSQKPAETVPRRRLQQAINAAGVKSVELAPRYRFRTKEELDTPQGPTEAMRSAVKLVEEAYDNLSAGRVLNPLPLRRAIVDLIDIDPAAPDLWEALADAPPMPAHAMTVSLVALLMGQELRLSAGVLQDLGLAALIHDAGYTVIPAEAVETPEGLHSHPAEGARIMLRQRGYHEGRLRRLRAILDHHRDYVEPRGRPSILGQILRLADDYATMVRLYAQQISPADALGAMARAAGRTYHPVLTQVLVNVLGRYPPGTLVELDDGRYARSVSPALSPETFAMPLVRVYDLRTRALSGERIDLAQGPAVRRALPG